MKTRSNSKREICRVDVFRRRGDLNEINSLIARIDDALEPFAKSGRPVLSHSPGERRPAPAGTPESDRRGSFAANSERELLISRLGARPIA